MRISAVTTYVCLLYLLIGCASQQTPKPTTRVAVDLSSNPPSGGYLDLNKNGRMDPYENSRLPIDKRIDDLLSRMNVDEKTCQMATLYGYPRVLKDDLPKPSWKEAAWKDGIANIDEHLNGWRGGRGADVESSVTNNPNYWPASAHVNAINAVQRWFLENI